MAWSTPRTWTTGEVVTAAHVNTYVSDDLSYLKGLVDGTVTQKVILAENALNPLTLRRTEGAAAILGHLAIDRNSAVKAWIGLNASDNFAILDASGTVVNLSMTDAGVVTLRGGIGASGAAPLVVTRTDSAALQSVVSLKRSNTVLGNIGFTAADTLAILNAVGNAALLSWTDAGAFTMLGQLKMPSFVVGTQTGSYGNVLTTFTNFPALGIPNDGTFYITNEDHTPQFAVRATDTSPGVTGGVFIGSGAGTFDGIGTLRTAGKITIQAGGLTVTAGGVTVTAGGVTVNAGSIATGGTSTGVAITAGNLAMSSNGYINIAGGTLASGTSATMLSIANTLQSVNGAAMSAIVASPTFTYTGSGTQASINVFESAPTTANVSFTTTDFIHYRVVGITKGASHTITNEYGILIDNIAGGSNKWAIKTGTGTVDFGGIVLTVASATSGAGLRIPHGAAPTSPVDGDIWTTTAGLYVRINGGTVGPLT